MSLNYCLSWTQLTLILTAEQVYADSFISAERRQDEGSF